MKLMVEDSRFHEPVKMLDPLTKYKWIDTAIYGYHDIEKLCHELKEKVVDPLEERSREKNSLNFQ